MGRTSTTYPAFSVASIALRASSSSPPGWADVKHVLPSQVSGGAWSPPAAAAAGGRSLQGSVEPAFDCTLSPPEAMVPPCSAALHETLRPKPRTAARQATPTTPMTISASVMETPRLYRLDLGQRIRSIIATRAPRRRSAQARDRSAALVGSRSKWSLRRLLRYPR